MPSGAGTSHPQGAPRSPPGPAALPGAPPVTDFTRLSNGITEISSQLSPDAPAVKTNPNYKRLRVPFCVTGTIKSSLAQSTRESCSGVKLFLQLQQRCRTHVSHTLGAARAHGAGGTQPAARQGSFWGANPQQTQGRDGGALSTRSQAQPQVSPMEHRAPCPSEGLEQGPQPMGSLEHRARALLHKESESGLCYPTLHNTRARKCSGNDRVRS